MTPQTKFKVTKNSVGVEVLELEIRRAYLILKKNGANRTLKMSTYSYFANEFINSKFLPHLNVEIKARCTRPDWIRETLLAHQARLLGEDHQVDTYFQVVTGRLKLREGNIENALIFYQRDDQAGPKKSEVTMYECAPDSNLKSVLTAAIGVKTVVDKRRSIFFIDNVKFHVDEVQALGSFVEIEAIDVNHDKTEAILLEQCQFYMNLLDIQPGDLLESSYSDML